MALPIKETPILTGKDAKVFKKRMMSPGSISKEEYERAKKVYNEMEEKKIKDIFNATILNCILKPETIICSDCGNVYSLKENKISLCVHFKRIFSDLVNW